MAVRIGLAYNLKPEAPANPAGATSDSPPSPDDPPSSTPSGVSPVRSLRTDLEQPDLYAEWDEPATIDAVERALATLGDVMRLEATEDFPARLAAASPDFVFNIAEGLYGPNREAHVPAICEFLGVPCHASDPLALSLALHKGRAKEIMAQHGVPTAPFVLARTRDDARNVSLPFPLFAKPAFEGSGKGVNVRSLCHNRADLVAQVEYLVATYRQPVLIETWLPGDEFTVAVIGNGAEARCLPLVGMRFDTLPAGAPPIYGYEAKWLWDTLSNPLDIYECPARIPEPLAGAVRAAALAAYQALECRDWLRGILPDPRDNAGSPKAARAAGMDYDELIRTVADIAWRRISGRSLLKAAAA